jgi:serine/threonine protein kinase
MGEVYRVRDTRLGRDVAVRVLLTVMAENADARSDIFAFGAVRYEMLTAHISQKGEGREVGAPERLSPYWPALRIFRSGMIDYDVAADGEKVLLDVPADTNTRPITLVSSWGGLIEGE